MRTGVSPKRIATGIIKLLLPHGDALCICHRNYKIVAHTLQRAPGSQQPNSNATLTSFPRKEVIQPHLPIRLPCYDFTPVIRPAFDGSLLSVGSPASGISDSHGVTGGVYKTRERIHRGILIRDY